MSDKLKKFVTEHKEEFDNNEPARDLWSKIDAKIDAKDPSRISSNWLSKFKYIWFSASILIIASYFIAKNMNNAAVNPAENKKETIATISDQTKAQSVIIPVNKEEEVSNEVKNEQQIKHGTTDPANSVSDHVESSRPDSSMKTGEDPKSAKGIPAIKEIKSDTSESKIEIASKIHIKKGKLFVPEQPQKINTYSCTLYEGADFCSILRLYKFPGKVGLDMGKMATISCSRLARTPNMKAIWLKGTTSKKIMFSLMEKFKSICLVKGDGRKMNPEAVSHYYPGLMVISAYNGKFFNVAFEDKVDMILFFKDAEEGDKIVIDGAIEAYVKDHQ